MNLERLRIFISSPGDVAEERVLANNLVRRLSDEFEQQLRIEPVFWEHEPLLATSTFQKQIPPPRDCEVALCILWSRIGTRLPADITRQKDTPFGPVGSRYASGTEYEFEDAALGFEENGTPDLLVYRKTAEPVVSLKDTKILLERVAQKEALDAFIQKWFFNPDLTLKAAFHTFATSAEFEQVLEQHLRKLIAKRLPTDGLAVPSAKPSWTAGSPFRGLQVFDFEHAPVFFGRTQAVGDLLTALRASAFAGRAFVLVVGVSGGGKSSLVRAGLLPLLVQPGVIEGVGLWRRAVMRPADAGDPIRSLAASLLAADALPELAADGTTAAQLAEGMRQNPGATVGLLKGALSQAAASFAREQGLTQQPDTRLVLVADQLEELFTLPNVTAADRQAFIAVLSALARGSKVWVVATLRGDFYHRCFELPELVAIKESTGQFDLPLPTPAEIGQIIRQPARAAGLSFEKDPTAKVPLDEVLREAAAASPESLPLLEFALEELYQRKTPAGLLTYAAYRDLGGVEGAIAQRAETVYTSLAPEVQATLPRVMRALVTVGTGDAVARQQATLEVVAPTPEANTLVNAFVQARLFSADRTEQGQAVVRVAHEALLRNWPRVVQSLERDKSLLIVRARVSAAAARWIADGKPADLLLGEGKPLAEAENLAAAWGDELSPADLALISASKARRTRRRVVLAAVLVVMIVAGLVIRSKVAEQQKATQADGLVKKLIAADTAQVPDAVNEISAYRQWADPLLRRENSAAAPGSREKLRTSLALLPVDGGQVDYLYRRLLTAEPNEVPVIRDALVLHRQALLDRLWTVVEKPERGQEPTRLRAAAALAVYDPESPKWATANTSVVNDLVKENPIFLGQWSEFFRPVKNALLQPLGAVFRDPQPARLAERNLATNLLADYAADQPDVLADLLMDADEKQFAAIFPKFTAQSEKGVPTLAAEIDRKLPATMPSSDDHKEKLAKRQANAAVALLRLNQPAKVWPLLQHAPDPRTRSYLIHRLSPLGADPAAIIARLDMEPDISIRRALILSLGEFGDQAITPEQRKPLVAKLQDLYRTVPDPGLHAAVEWLLRTWKQDAWLAEMNEQWKKDDPERSRKLKTLAAATQPTVVPSLQWYVNTQGQTFIVIPGPVEFEMGSPETEADRSTDEAQHRVRISRTVALAAKAVSFGDYRAFDDGYKTGDKKYALSPNQPVVATNWYQAAAYCNWLSQQEHVPPDQWAYEIPEDQLPKIRAGQAGVSMRTKQDYLSLAGYRLPTEAELEYATRADAVTSRYFGQTDDLLGYYAWYETNSGNNTHPVGTRKPNDFGFFDTHGNCWCWSQDVAYRFTPSADAHPVADAEQTQYLDISGTDERVLRGGSFIVRASLVRSSFRYGVVPTYRSVNISFRSARTLPLVPFTSLPPPP